MSCLLYACMQKVVLMLQMRVEQMKKYTYTSTQAIICLVIYSSYIHADNFHVWWSFILLLF